jgi:hypothetical protein
MNAQEQLRLTIDEERARLRADIPASREGAILVLLRLIDRLPPVSRPEIQADLVSGRHFAELGANLALQLCLEAPDDAAPIPDGAGNGLDDWARHFLEACARLAKAELVLAHAETGFMRLVANDDGTFAAWIATKRTPASWRERADIDWWAAWLARRHAGEIRAIETERAAASSKAVPEGHYWRLANVYLEMMAYQLGYPLDTEIGGYAIRTYRDVLAALLARALRARNQGAEAEPQSQPALIAALAADLALAPEAIGNALAGFTLDRENAAYHAAVPGFALAPLVRVAPNRLAWSLRGLTTEPFFFLTRELRRRDAQQYHNSAHLREGVFRDDLYRLLADKRFVTSAGRIVLRRDAGDARTDVDAAVFDRKSGALALFELKSQDPFARSTAELVRQRDNVLYANRQIGGMLDWLKRQGADEILNRVDRRTAKTFRVQKVYPFVLGRYLAHFHDGPQPDRRAAWGTWPQLLRLRDGHPFASGEANPLGSLFTQLTNDAPIVQPPEDQPPREITMGAARIIIYPSYAAFRVATTCDAGKESRAS